MKNCYSLRRKTADRSQPKRTRILPLKRLPVDEAKRVGSEGATPLFHPLGQPLGDLFIATFLGVKLHFL